MEFSPIPGIRSDSLTRIQRVESDLPAPLAVEAAAKPGDDDGDRNRRAQQRALANQAMMAAEDEADEPTDGAASGRKVNFFA